MRWFRLSFVLILATGGVAQARPTPTRVLARQTITDEQGLCARSRVACGQIMRPIDPSGAIRGMIVIAYARYEHWGSGPASSTIVAQEGGPGLSSLGSFSSYKALYAPLLRDHDLVVIDARGTGRSAAIDCQPLQDALLPTSENVGACGRALAEAADDYGTGLAVEDMIAVLDRLGVRTFDYYGDSYGTFLGQTLAARYPHRLRSMVLDGAYPVIGESPWYPHAGELVRAGFNLACERAPYCATLPGTSLGRIAALLQQLRQKPINGVAPDANGLPRRVMVDPVTLGLTLYGSFGLPTYRDLDAASRATKAGDVVPLLRLIAENETGEYGPAGPPSAYSRGLFAASVCMDAPAIFDLTAPPALRKSQRDDAIAQKKADDPGIYGPLTIDEFASVPIDYSYLNLCLEWPFRKPPYRPGHPIPTGASFTAAPTLVINGELDMLTPPADGAVVAGQFPNARQLVIANSFHVDALGDVDDCTQNIVRRFTASLHAGDVTCATQVKPVRLTPFFALKATDAIPATATAGNVASSRELSLASAAMQTASDAIARWYINYSGNDVGLRGGKWSYVQNGAIVNFMLDGARWSKDLAVTGSIRWNQADGAIAADLTIAADEGSQGRIRGRWNDHQSYSPAHLSGVIDNHTLRAMMPAP